VEPSYQVLKKAIVKVGVKLVAAQLHISHSLVYKWCQDSAASEDHYLPASGTQNPLDRIQRIYELTKDPAVISWICQMADGFFVKNAVVEDVPADVRMFRNVQKFVKEFSETLDTIGKCYSDDSRIDNCDATMIRKEWEELKQIGESFVRACESGRFSPSRPAKGKLER
jgi:hypothetical protein